jgi:hypothetical protein
MMKTHVSSISMFIFIEKAKIFRLIVRRNRRIQAAMQAFGITCGQAFASAEIFTVSVAASLGLSASDGEGALRLDIPGAGSESCLQAPDG